MSPLALWQMHHPASLCDDMRIDSLNALGCTLSHRRAWQRLLDTPDVDVMVVFEDDACLDERIGPTLRGDPAGSLTRLLFEETISGELSGCQLFQPEILLLKR